MRTGYRIDRWRVRRWVEENEKTQVSLAERMGCSPNTLSHAVRNGYNCRMDLLLNLSDATGLDVRELVEEVPATVAGR